MRTFLRQPSTKTGPRSRSVVAEGGSSARILGLRYFWVAAALLIVALASVLLFAVPAWRGAQVVELPVAEEAFLPWSGEVRVTGEEGQQPFRPSDAVSGQGTTLFLDAGAGQLVQLLPGSTLSYFTLGAPEWPSPTGTATKKPQFSHLTLTQTGTLLLTDTANSQVWSYSLQGRFLGPFLTEEERRAAGLGSPTAITQDAQGRVLIADTSDQTIKVFDKVGRLLSTFGGAGTGPGQFSFPTDILEDGAGNLFVADSNNRRIQVFDRSHRFLRAFSQTRGSMALALPRSLALDALGRLHVADTFGERVSVFSPGGEFLGSYGFTGPSEQRLALPAGLALVGGQAIVGDRGNQRLVLYGK